jgi:hypothetical protein
MVMTSWYDVKQKCEERFKVAFDEGYSRKEVLESFEK